MEVQQSDGIECAIRCLDALVTTEDFETRLALWKAAKRYANRDRLERTAGLEVHRPLPRAVLRGCSTGEARNLVEG
jgi:hypothetical protein